MSKTLDAAAANNSSFVHNSLSLDIFFCIQLARKMLNYHSQFYNGQKADNLEVMTLLITKAQT